MIEFLADNYLWIKAFHAISVIAWMAGMLYLPRLYVYHTTVAVGSEAAEMLKLMERRLLRLIINPAMIATFLFGIGLLFTPGIVDWSIDGWLHAKIFLVVLMTGFHGMLARWRKDFAADKNKHSQKFYRIINEIPTALMVFIVILAIVKPF